MVRRWRVARWLAVVGAALLGYEASRGMATGSAIGRSAWSDLPWLVWSGIILWYFLRPAVKAQFKSARSE